MYRRFGKRLCDVLIAMAGLILVAPVLVLVAVLVRLKLGSPVFFRQVRPGLHGQPFWIIKFRTMTDERDASGKHLPDTQRLTPLGKFLRRTSLDELPELLNVLKGEMSLVGPRPLIPRYTPYYTERERTRLNVLPGITGWAQINGRNNLPWDNRLECDAWYVEHYSLWLDLKILALTVVKVLRRENVQPDSSLVSFRSLDKERQARGMEPAVSPANEECAP